MVYFMKVTEEIIVRKPQIELDIINSWVSKYSKIREVEQRLVKPNRSADMKYPLDRKKFLPMEGLPFTQFETIQGGRCPWKVFTRFSAI